MKLPQPEFLIRPGSRTVLGTLLALLLAACNLPGGQSAPPAQLSASATRPPASPTITVPAVQTPTTVDDFFARCPTAEEIASVNAKLTLSFETDPTAGTLVCTAAAGSADLTLLQKRAYQSIIVMKYLQFDQPLPWTDKQLFDWFTGTITGVRFRSDIANSSCCDPANVINILVSDNSYVMLTDKWFAPEIGGGLQDTMVLYVHEARHNEDEGYPHTCNGCDDQTIAEMGSWAVQYYLFYWLAEHSDRAFLRPFGHGSDRNFYRQMALQNAVNTRRVRFCGEPTPTPGSDPTLSP